LNFLLLFKMIEKTTTTTNSEQMGIALLYIISVM